MALGNFQRNLSALVDYCDYLAIEYGSPDQQSILLKIKMYAKVIKTLSNYWHYIDSLTGAIEIFIENIPEEDEDFYRREFEKYLAHTKASLVVLQKVSRQVSDKTSYFASMIVKIPFDLNATKPMTGKTSFVANAINNLTYYRRR